MTGKVIGACLIVIGCGGFGFHMTAAFKREEASLRQLVAALDYMQCELQYRLTPLPDLCRQAGNLGKSTVCSFFANLSEELEHQTVPDVSSCFQIALAETDTLPEKTCKALKLMGTSLGRFDVNGQINGIESVRAYCRSELSGMVHNRESRLRSYQTLGLCAGAALAILFV